MPGKSSSLYVHIPFCHSKCLYCDFFSGGASKADWDSLVSGLAIEAEIRKHELVSAPDTLYIGGGTPSIMPAQHFGRLASELKRILGIANPREFTVEANPEDVTESKCLVWKEAGVNRVSMGLQSLDDGELKAVGRRHSAQKALEAFRMLERHFGNISVDLMFGLPGQTVESWTGTLERTLQLQPHHISCYSLMLEERTPLTVMHNSGRIGLPGEEEVLRMWETMISRMERRGYDHYEISNFALPGFQSVHNSRYWRFNPYLGLGPSAHSYDGKNIRRWNPADLKGYLERYSGHDVDSVKPFYEEERLGHEERLEETVMLSLRTKEGLDLTAFAEDFGETRRQELFQKAACQQSAGMIRIDRDRIRLTRKGIMTSDRVIVELL